MAPDEEHTDDHKPPIRRSSILGEAFRIGGVVFGGYIVLGMGLGILISSLGLPFWVAPLISLVVYAGSVEFLLVGLIASGAPLMTIVINTFLVNSRHLVYGLSFPLENIRGATAKFYGIYSLTDEQFALNAGPGSYRHSQGRLMSLGILLHLSWISGSALGMVVGSSFLSQLKGVDFVMTALFIILAMDAYRAQKDNIAALCALVSAGIAIVFFPGSMLTVAMFTYVALLIIRHLCGGRRVQVSTATASLTVLEGQEDDRGE